MMSGKYAGHARQLDDRGTTAAGQRGDWWSQGAKKYSSAHGTSTTGGPWAESPGQGVGGRGEREVSSGVSIKAANKVAP